MTLRNSLRTWATAIVLAVLVTMGLVVSRGSASYVVTHGVSMEPRFHQGDLAVVVQSSHYDVGDVVAYHSKLLDTVVMHRIIRRDGASYVFKGDNNSWEDRDQPTRRELVGRLLFKLPRAGLPLQWLTAHWLLGATGFVLATGWAGAGHRRHRRKKGQPMRESSPRNSPTRQPSVVRAVVVASTAALVASVLLGALAWSRPTTRATTVPLPFSHRGAFAYSAAVTPGAVYDSTALRTGDPIFRRLVSAVDVRFDYRLDSEAIGAVTGTVALRAHLSDPNGWRRDIEIGAPAPVRHGAGTATAVLDINRIQGAIDQFEASTGVRGGPYTVGVEAAVDVAGRLGTQPLRDAFAAQLDFQLDALQLRPAWSAANAVGTLRPAKAGSIRTPTTTPRQLRLVLVHVDVKQARQLAALAAVLSVAVLLVSRRRLGQQSAAVRIAARHGHRIVPVAAAGSDGHQAVVDVTTMDDLVRLATQYDCLILHEHRAESDRYVFQVDRTVYRFVLRSTAVA